jgi:DNA mismatch repair protein MutS2
MNTHALTVLEFPRVLEVVAGHASSDLGATRIRSLTPQVDRVWLDREHGRVAALGSALTGDSPWHPEPIPALGDALDRIRIEGIAWSTQEFLGAGILLRSSRRTKEALGDDRRSAVLRGALAPVVDRLVAVPALEQEIGRVIHDDATVRDDASPALRRIRRELRASHGELMRLLERVLSRLDPSARVADISITVRNGRYVIPLRRDARESVGGIVHDASASGATLFVEPPAAVEFGNRIRELEADETDEIDRILRELTDRVRPHRVALLGALDALVELDTLYGRARFAQAHGCAGSTLVPSREGFMIVNGRHPLLLAQGRDVVPFDLAMHGDERTLLVSGPNTGGKTVLLKAIGLLSALAQSGIPAPTSATSRIPLFDDFFADIGDEQSIEASLSTFSAHVKNLAEVLRRATADSLVLIDELGSGTDPVEGAALGWAILESLTFRGTMTVATTHLGTLKELASQVPGVVNASLQFDGVALEPTYRLIKGVPGRSYGISIARRLDVPESVIARAEERLPQQERDMAALIERLEDKDKELTAREAESGAILDDARGRIADVAKRERIVRDRERAVERESRQDARRYLLDARAEIERTLRALKQQGAQQGAQQGPGGIEEAGRDARQLAERLAASQSSELDRLDREEAKVQRSRATDAERHGTRRTVPIAAGDVVALGTLDGRTGRVIELRDAEALVSVGAVKLTVPLSTLSRAARAESPERAVAWTGDLPDVYVSSEIDLRGLRSDEAEAIVMQAVDSAIRADLKLLRIIHGKGTGALRERVTEMLRNDTRVHGFRFGAWNEGGAGVTVVEF